MRSNQNVYVDGNTASPNLFSSILHGILVLPAFVTYCVCAFVSSLLFMNQNAAILLQLASSCFHPNGPNDIEIALNPRSSLAIINIIFYYIANALTVLLLEFLMIFLSFYSPTFMNYHFERCIAAFKPINKQVTQRIATAPCEEMVTIEDSPIYQ